MQDVTGIAYSSPESYEDNPREMMKQAKIKDRKEQRKTKSGGSGGAEDGGRSQGEIFPVQRLSKYFLCQEALAKAQESSRDLGLGRQCLALARIMPRTAPACR